jgi:Domain of unknown function (DUF5916)/Carbohydrate family 9 binding domain-like
MKHFYAVLLVIFSCNFIQAQTTTDLTAKTRSDENNTPDTIINLAKIKREPLVIPKIVASPVIDGKPDEEVWKNAAVIKDFIQTQPGDNIAPSKPTEGYLAYDEQNLYVAFKCWDEKDKIRATVVQRDGAFNEDNVRIWLDTYDDQRRAYVIGANPFGIQQDGIQTEGQGTDFNFDILMESKGVIEDWGWSVEMKIPFKSLRYTAGKGKLWGFNAARNIDRMNDELDTWVPISRDLPGFISKFGKLTGLDEIKAERTFEIIPTFTVKETGNLVSPTKFSNPPVQTDFGFTAKYQITPNVTLDAAYNPDFADTEADAPVVEANQRFPIFFQEKRPFFLEGVDTFRTPVQAVYTRRIQNPDAALKLSGKTGKISFGVFGAVDNPLNNNPLQKKAYAAVFRVKRDIGKESNIGVLATSYNYYDQRKIRVTTLFGTVVKDVFTKTNNRVFGLDGKWNSNSGTQARGQILASNSKSYFYNPNIDDEEFRTGNAVSYDYLIFHNKRNFTYGFGGRGATKDFRADLGFTNRTDTNQFFTFIELGSDPKPKAFIISKNLNTSFGVRHDFQGRLQSFGFDSNINLGLKGNAEVGFGGSANKEILVEDEFGPKRNSDQTGAFFGKPRRSANQASFFAYGNKNFSKRFSLNGSGSLSLNSFDFDFGGGRKFVRVSPAAIASYRIRPFVDAPLDPGTGTEVNIDIGAEVKPTDEFNFEVGFNKTEFRRNDTKLLAFISNIATFRSTYQFSRFVSVKARLDYNTLNGRLFGQYTFGWTPSPGKALFVGYNDSSNYNGYVFGSRQDGYQQLNRTFFIKLSYLFRKSF